MPEEKIEEGLTLDKKTTDLHHPVSVSTPVQTILQLLDNPFEPLRTCQDFLLLQNSFHRFPGHW